MKLKKLVGAITLTAAGVFSAASMAAIDETLPMYEKTSGVSGNLSSVGSDTLANMMTLWAEEFKHIYPNVNIQIQAAGSSTAPPALTEGTSFESMVDFFKRSIPKKKTNKPRTY